MGSILPKIKENYIIKDKEADYYNMKGDGPFMVDSFGKKYLRPSLYPFRYSHPINYNIIPNQFYPYLNNNYIKSIYINNLYNPSNINTFQNYNNILRNKF